MKHILIIPSERFVPKDHPLEGIFAYHQACILQQSGYKIGALSIELSFSVPMFLKGSFLKLFGRKAGNATDQFSFFSLIKFAFSKIFYPKRFILTDIVSEIKVYRINGLYRRPPVANRNHLSWVGAGLICYDKYVRENGRPDVIHAHEAIYAGMLAEKIYSKDQVPYIITEHSTFYATGKVDKKLSQRVSKSYSSAAGLFAVSNTFATFLNQTFGMDRFRYLPNVLDPLLENAAYEERHKDKKKFRFLNIALLKPVKDHKKLLDAFKIVAQKKQNVELAIAGTGDLQNELIRYVEKIGLHEKVTFLGLLSREEVINEIKDCHCFVLSSKYETFGVVIIEAMLFGKPVISTNVGVSQTIINSEIGYVVNDERSMADAMLSVIEKYNSYNSGFIRDFTITNFGKRSFVKRMNKIYSEVVQ